MQPKPTSAVTKGIIISLILIALSLVIYFLGLQKVSGLQYISHLILIVGIIWAIASYAKQIDYNATYGKYFLHGFAVTAVVTCLMIIFTALFITLDPSMKQEALDAATEQMRKNQNLSDEQVNQALEMTRKFFLPMALGGVLLIYMFFGTIVALVAAAVIKKNPRPVFEHEDFDNIKPIA